MNKLNLTIVSALALTAGCVGKLPTEKGVAISSPDGRNEIRVYSSPLAYEVSRDGKLLVGKTPVGMKVNGKCLNGGESKSGQEKIGGEVATPVYKKSRVSLAATKGTFDFGDWAFEVVARNDGVAYRFVTRFADRATVACERAGLSVPAKARCWYNATKSVGCEETVPQAADADKLALQEKEMAYLPFVYSVEGKTVAVTESNLHDYPIWNLVPGKAADGFVAFDGRFEPEPKSEMRVGGWGSKKEDMDIASGGRWLWIKEAGTDLVRTEGSRAFPWRTFVLADAPSKLCEADIVYALAEPAKGDFSWVKPGKVAWDWWNAFDNQGNEGCNTKTYERFIDFAAKRGVEYVIFDEGWSEALNIWKFHPDVDVPHLIDYAAKRNVGIILWIAWAQAADNEEKVAEHFAKLGAKGFKVDFFDRGDARIARFLDKFAAACARHKLVVDYHGIYRPTGLSRTYPNVLNYEGIHGLEQMKFYHGEDMMANDVGAFFLRLTAGPMDYTPGAMMNYPVGRYLATAKEKDINIYNLPGSEGTRCHQMAMMTLYEAYLQMLSDSPTNYEKNLDSFAFMAATPVTWDETVGLGGCPESMAAAARRNGNVWYAAGLNNATARDFTLDTSFLGSGEWKAEIFRDAEDAAAEPTHYAHLKDQAVKAGAKLAFRMAPGGGFVVRFTR